LSLAGTTGTSRHGGHGYSLKGSVFVLVATLLCCFGPGLVAGTGAVPLAGSLSASLQEGGADSGVVWLYFNVTALEPSEQLLLEIILPDGVSADDDSGTRQLFRNVIEQQTVSMALAVRLTDQSEAMVIASATLIDDENLTLRGSYVFTFNPAPEPEEQTQELLDSDGDRLIVYPSEH
jgi:hypothetical protein